MADAGIEDRRRIDGMLASRQLSGIDPAKFSQFLGMNPRVTGDLDYSTAGFTTQYAAMLIASGACEIVACVYGRNIPGTMRDFSGVSVYDLDCGLVNANAVIGRVKGDFRHLRHGGIGIDTAGQTTRPSCRRCAVPTGFSRDGR